MKLIYVEPAEYFTPSARKILEEGETNSTKRPVKKSAKKQQKIKKAAKEIKRGLSLFFQDSMLYYNQWRC